MLERHSPYTHKVHHYFTLRSLLYGYPTIILIIISYPGQASGTYYLAKFDSVKVRLHWLWKLNRYPQTDSLYFNYMRAVLLLTSGLTIITEYRIARERAGTRLMILLIHITYFPGSGLYTAEAAPPGLIASQVVPGPYSIPIETLVRVCPFPIPYTSILLLLYYYYHYAITVVRFTMNF